MSAAQEVIEHIHGLHRDFANTKSHSDWLQHFQQAPEAWSVVLELLGGGNEEVVQYFAAHTVVTKLPHPDRRTRRVVSEACRNRFEADADVYVRVHQLHNGAGAAGGSRRKGLSWSQEREAYAPGDGSHRDARRAQQCKREAPSRNDAATGDRQPCGKPHAHASIHQRIPKDKIDVQHGARARCGTGRPRPPTF